MRTARPPAAAPRPWMSPLHALTPLHEKDLEVLPGEAPPAWVASRRRERASRPARIPIIRGANDLGRRACPPARQAETQCERAMNPKAVIPSRPGADGREGVATLADHQLTR